jgi:hypothetical protein
LNDLYDKKSGNYGEKSGFDGSKRGSLAVKMASIWRPNISPMPVVLCVPMQTKHVTIGVVGALIIKSSKFDKKFYQFFIGQEVVPIEILTLGVFLPFVALSFLPKALV